MGKIFHAIEIQNWHLSVDDKGEQQVCLEIVSFKVAHFNFLVINGLYYKQITIVNDDSRMTLQVVALPSIVILTPIKVSFTLIENIYSKAVNHDDRILMVQATRDRCPNFWNYE